MRQNPVKAAAEQRRGGRGPVYRRLLEFERAQDRRFGRVGAMCRPRYLLDALERGETVTVAAWRAPALMRQLGCQASEQVILTPEM